MIVRSGGVLAWVYKRRSKSRHNLARLQHLSLSLRSGPGEKAFRPTHPARDEIEWPPVFRVGSASDYGRSPRGIGSPDHSSGQNQRRDPDEHDHSGSNTAYRPTFLLTCGLAVLRHDFRRHQPDDKHHPERDEDHVVQIAKDRNEVRNEVNRG